MAISFPEVIRAAVWTARTQEIHPDVFLDGAHNMNGVLWVAETRTALAAKHGKEPLLLTSSIQDRELAATAGTSVRVLHPTCIYLAPLRTSRGTEMHTLADIYHGKGAIAVKTCGSVGEALRQARREQVKNATLFITGSLYLTGEVLTEESR